MSIHERASFEWKTSPSFGKAMPPMRVNSGAAVCNNSVWLIGGKGVGLSNEVWRFSLEDSDNVEWECEKTLGDPPNVRDSHSLTYIGGDKLLLFGGQGLHNDNDRTLRQTKTQTYKVFQSRELFNDTHIFDCAKLMWSRVHCKSQVPFSRRGHSATWVPPFYSERISRPGPANPVIPDGSLILFGGSGMDTFTGIEVAFNDMWIYYPDKEWWEMIITRGIPPIPTFLHTATLQGDFLVTIGGLADPSPPTSIATTGKDKKITQITNYAKPISGVMLFNIRTLSWSHLELNNPTNGQTIGAFYYGLTGVSDPNNADCIFIFGGRDTGEVVPDKKGLLRKAYVPKRRGNVISVNPHVFHINIKTCTMTDIVTLKPTPENRYGHVCVSVLPPDYRSLFYDRQKRAGGGLGFTGGSNNETMLYLYGGTKIDKGGYAAPHVYHLVKTITYMDEMNSAFFEEEKDPLATIAAKGFSHLGLAGHSGELHAGGSNHGSESRSLSKTPSKLEVQTHQAHSFVSDNLNVNGEGLFEMSMWEKLEKMAAMVHYANEMKKVRELSPEAVPATENPELMAGMGGNSPMGSAMAGGMSGAFGTVSCTTHIQPLKPKTPSTYKELKLSLSYSLSDVVGSERSERIGGSVSQAVAMINNGMLMNSTTPGRPPTAQGHGHGHSYGHGQNFGQGTGHGSPSHSHMALGGRPSTSHGARHPDHGTDFMEVHGSTRKGRPSTGHGRSHSPGPGHGNSHSPGRPFSPGMTVNGGSQTLGSPPGTVGSVGGFDLASGMFSATCTRPRTAPAHSAKYATTRKPHVYPHLIPEVEDQRRQLILAEKSSVRKNAASIRKEVLPRMEGCNLKQARDRYLTHCCPPALFPHHRNALAAANRPGISGPAGPPTHNFFISSPHSQSMRPTATPNSHHHNSQVENFK